MSLDQKVEFIASQLPQLLKAMNDAGKMYFLQHIEEAYRDWTGAKLPWSPDETGL